MSAARHQDEDVVDDPGFDPPVLLLAADRDTHVVTARVTAARVGLLREIAHARHLVVDEHEGVDAGGLARLDVKVGTGHGSIEQLARVCDLFAQVVGACVIGSTVSPVYVDVDRDGRNRLAGCVEETFERLVQDVGLAFRPIHL